MADGHRIIGRSEWGARHREGVGTRKLPCTRVFAHHTVTASAGPDATLAADMAAMRKVEDVGDARFGTISYPYCITEAGRILRGLSDDRIGAHTRGYNTTGTAFAFIGNYDVLAFNPKMRAAAVWLLRDLRRRKVITLLAALLGHFQVAATACPGKHIRGMIGAMDAESRKEETMASINRIVVAFVRPVNVQAAIAALAKLGIRAYEADPDTARITRKSPPGTPE